MSCTLFRSVGRAGALLQRVVPVRALCHSLVCSLPSHPPASVFFNHDKSLGRLAKLATSSMAIFLTCHGIGVMFTGDLEKAGCAALLKNNQQFPLMTWESYATREADSSVRVSTSHCRLVKSFLDSTCQAVLVKADSSRDVGRALPHDGRSPG